MTVTMLKSKIHRATVTEANLNYVGSITIDSSLMKAAGIFEYENMPLSDIAVQLSRWYDVRIIFAAPEFANRRFTGVVRKYDVLNDVLSIIEQTTDVCFIVNGKEIVVKATGLD